MISLSNQGKISSTLVVNADLSRSKKQGYVGTSLTLNQKIFMFTKVGGDQRVPLVFFRYYATYRSEKFLIKFQK